MRSWVLPLCYLLLVVNQFGEVYRFQSRAADQAAVDFRLCHQICHVAGVHAAAVLNADVFAHFSAEFFGNRRTDHAANAVCFVRGSGFAGADGPYRFICDHDGGEIFHALQGRDGLVGNQFVRYARFTLFQRFAYADDGFQVVSQRAQHFFCLPFRRFLQNTDGVRCGPGLHIQLPVR